MESDSVKLRSGYLRTGRYAWRLPLAVLLPALLLAGCRKENQFDCLKSTGHGAIERRELPDFDHLTVHDGIDVELVNDTVNFVEWHAGEHLLSSLTNDLEKGSLHLRNINKCNWVRSYHRTLKAVVHTTSLAHVLHDGYGTVSTPQPFVRDSMMLEVTDAGDMTLDLTTRWLLTRQYTSGNLTLKGKSDYLFAGNNGVGRLLAQEFATSVIYASCTGEGDMKVYPMHVLNSKLTNYGNLYFVGSPIWTDTVRTGKGRYIQIR